MANRNVNDLYNFFQYIVRKQRGIYVLPSQFNQMMDSAQLDAVEDWFAPYGVTQIIHDAIKDLRVYYQFTSDASGFVICPSDYLHMIGTPFTVTGSTVNTIKFVNEDELPFALTSQLRAITNTYPIGVDTAAGFSIYPQQTQVGFFNYLRRPLQIVFGYTQVGRVITYDPATSQDPEFADVFVNNILARALAYAGVNMDEEGISKFADMYNKETQ